MHNRETLPPVVKSNTWPEAATKFIPRLTNLFLQPAQSSSRSPSSPNQFHNSVHCVGWVERSETQQIIVQQCFREYQNRDKTDF